MKSTIHTIFVTVFKRIGKNCRLKKEPRFSRIVLEETFKVERLSYCEEIYTKRGKALIQISSFKEMQNL